MSVHSGELAVTGTVRLGTTELDTSAEFVAVRSKERGALPFIKWSVLRAVPGTAQPAVNGNEFGLRYLNPHTSVLWTPVTPPVLTRVVLTADPLTYKQLDPQRVLAHLPPFLTQGETIPELNCRIRALEPAAQGLVPSDPAQLAISVFETEEPAAASVLEPLVGPFITPEISELSVKVEPFSRAIALRSLLPPVPSQADPENIACLKLSSLVKLGCFSGDLVRLGDRLLHIYSYPEPSDAEEGVVYVTPMTCFNMGAPASLMLAKVPQSSEIELAREVTLSRVSSPVSSDKANQAASLRGLRSYFQGVSRVVRNSDLVAIPVNTELAKILGVVNADDTEDELDLNILHDEDSQPDQVVWFQVHGLPDDKKQYYISPAHTRMVQSGVAQCAPPSTSLRWRSFVGLPSFFDYTSNPKLFSYAFQLQKLLKATLVRDASVTVLLKSSKRGAGKASLLTSLAAQLGIHEMTISAYDLLGDSDSKTLGLLKARLERAASTSKCLVTILHLEALGKKHDMDGKDTNLVNGLVEVLDEILGTHAITLAATVSDPDLLAASVRNKFKFEVDVTVPSENEREAIFKYLLASSVDSEPRNLEPGIFLGFGLRGDVSLNSLAVQSAGLAPPDLRAIVRNAKQISARKASRDAVICNRGMINLTPSDIGEAIKEARSKFSDSIGAPKIPNVGWKDVGGLDMVKGEILDTIDMPLKHPELFGNGLKKRSGILFYGPPGTGKTLLAKAIATNFSLNFFSVKGPELLNMYIGESEANVRRVFQKARDAKPCVVFFDELDSVAPKRGNKGDSGGVMDRIVSQLLAELDGMSEGSDGVFVVGATNRPDLLDEALLRPGRFDKMLYLGVSDTHDKQRTILEALTRKFELSDDVSLEEVADMCPFTYTGADFYAMSSDAMLNAMTRTAGEIDAKIAAYNKNSDTPISIRKWFQSVASETDTKVRVSKQDFAKAQRELVPSVSAEELQHYLRVRKSFEGN